MPGQKAPEQHRRENILRAAYDVAARRGVEALTLRAVAVRGAVSHGTVLFYFKRRNELIASLFDRVLEATVVLRLPSDVKALTTPAERLEALVRAEMDRLSDDPRHFRLFLEYWSLGVRNAAVRRKVSAALDRYREAIRVVAEGVAAEESPTVSHGTQEGLAAVVVSLIHGCALQAVIDPRGFDVRQHLDAAVSLLAQLARLQSASFETQPAASA